MEKPKTQAKKTTWAIEYDTFFYLSIVL